MNNIKIDMTDIATAMQKYEDIKSPESDVTHIHFFKARVKGSEVVCYESPEGWQILPHAYCDNKRVYNVESISNGQQRLRTGSIPEGYSWLELKAGTHKAGAKCIAKGKVELSDSEKEELESLNAQIEALNAKKAALYRGARERMLATQKAMREGKLTGLNDADKKTAAAAMIKAMLDAGLTAEDIAKLTQSE